MMAAVSALPDQLSAALDIAGGFEFRSGQRDSVVIAGMGGSGLCGDVARMVLSEVCDVPMMVVKDDHLPRFVGEGTLVLAISYSGNTRETLACYEQARSARAAVISISSGGSLQALAEEYGLSHLSVPGGLQPRAALGYMSVAASCALAQVFEVDIGDQVREAMGVTEALSLELTGGEPNLALELSERLLGKVAVIYGASPAARIAAVRWKCQLNENSKVPAFYAHFPELGHNEIVGWSEGNPLQSSALLVGLADQKEPDRGYRAALAIAAEGSAGLVTLNSRGLSRLARFLSLAYVGDFVSVYLARARGVDPTPVHAIDRLKAETSRS